MIGSSSETFSLAAKSETLSKACIVVSLSAGNLISIWSMSSTIPRNDRDVEGPSSLSDTNGTPESVHMNVKVSRFYWNMADTGGLIVR